MQIMSINSDAVRQRGARVAWGQPDAASVSSEAARGRLAVWSGTCGGLNGSVCSACLSVAKRRSSVSSRPRG
jgi:hypothetical protein